MCLIDLFKYVSSFAFNKENYRFYKNDEQIYRFVDVVGFYQVSAFLCLLKLHYVAAYTESFFRVLMSSQISDAVSTLLPSRGKQHILLSCNS